MPSQPRLPAVTAVRPDRAAASMSEFEENNMTTIPANPSPIVSGTTPLPASANGSSASAAAAANALANTQIAGNFQSFLQLLTTQLQNQDPLSPLDTNQFTQQLVEFASVEQQINMNTNLQTLISLQQTSDATAAMQYLGADVTINSNAATLSNATSTP